MNTFMDIRLDLKINISTNQAENYESYHRQPQEQPKWETEPNPDYMTQLLDIIKDCPRADGGVQHPIDAYLLIRRLTVDLKHVLDFLNETPNTNASCEYSTIHSNDL